MPRASWPRSIVREGQGSLVGRSSRGCWASASTRASGSGSSQKAFRADAQSGVLERLGQALEPGAAVAAVLVEHVWVRRLDDAVARIGGRPLASDLVDAAALGELSADLLAAAARGAQAG